MLDRMAATLTDWTERSPADLGVTLVETLAYAADRTSWFQDAVGTEAYLGRARLRQSALRHARLLGYRASEGTNARVAVAFDAALDAVPADPILPIGTRLLTRPSGLRGTIAPVVPRDPERLEEMIGAGSIVFETLEPLRSLKVASQRDAPARLGRFRLLPAARLDRGLAGRHARRPGPGQGRSADLRGAHPVRRQPRRSA